MRVEKELHIYTDGACHAEIGGYASVIVNPATNQHIEIAAGPISNTTNNQMEMMAVISAMRFLTKRAGPQRLLIMSDSKYVVNGITDWINNWKKNGWTNAKGMPVKNANLWQMMERERNRHIMTRFQWVRGHDGNHYNEMADRAAVSKRQSSAKLRSLGVTA